MMSQPLTVQTVTASGVNEYGDEVRGVYGTPASVFGYLEQLSSVEVLNDRDTAISQWRAFLPAGTIIGHLDRVGFLSQIFQVNGEPHHVYNPRTRTVSHIECALTVVVG